MKKNQFYWIAVLVIALQFPVLFASAQNEPVVAYVTIQSAKSGILKGNSVAKATAGMIECVGYNYTLKTTLNIGSQSSGIGAGKLNPISIQIIKHADNLSAQLMQMMIDGETITSLTIQIYKGASEPTTLIQSIKFDIVGISQIIQYAGKSNTTPDEQIDFTAAKVETDSSSGATTATTTAVPKTVTPTLIKSTNLREVKKN